MGMPRFCSSNTRPNSFEMGSPISVATMFMPKPRLCPARSERAIISKASGSCAAKARSRFRRRKSTHKSGTLPKTSATSGISTGWITITTASAIPAAARTPAIIARRLMVSDVSACSSSKRMLPKRSK